MCLIPHAIAYLAPNDDIIELYMKILPVFFGYAITNSQYCENMAFMINDMVQKPQFYTFKKY